MTTVAIEPIFLDKKTAAQVVALSEKTFERRVQAGLIPKPRQISDGRVGWLVADLVKWATNLPVSEILPPANTGAKKPRDQGTECAS